MYFIHSFIPAISIAPFKSSTTQRRSRLQHGYCIGVSRRSAQATVSKGLAQVPYVVARAAFEPMTLLTKGVDSTNEPKRPTRRMFTSVTIAKSLNTPFIECKYLY